MKLPFPMPRSPSVNDDKFCIETSHRTTVRYTTRGDLRELQDRIDKYINNQMSSDVFVEHNLGSEEYIDQFCSVEIDSADFSKTRKTANKIVNIVESLGGKVF